MLVLCYHFTLQNCKQRKGVSGLDIFANHGVKHSDKHVYRIVNCIGNLVSILTAEFLQIDASTKLQSAIQQLTFWPTLYSLSH